MILLDTHVLLWLLLEPERLGVNTTAHLRQSAEPCYSAVSTAELMIKHMLGKLEIVTDLGKALPDHGFTALPLTPAHAEAIRDFPELADHDPFDRLLLAQAYVEGADFLTADRRLLALARPWILDARA